ncbi:MAG: DUF4169 family protein [Gaiellaceae bacterium]
MERKRKKKTEQERIAEIERELAGKSSSERLLERMAYHRRKIAEERVRRERPLWRRLLPG